MDSTHNDLTVTPAPELPVAHSVAALLLLVIGNKRSARQADVTDDATKWKDSIDYANSLGWHIAVDKDGTAYADVVPPPRSYTDWWSYLRSRVNETRFFKEVTRKFVLPRLAYLTRERSANAINSGGPIGAGGGVTATL